MRNNRRVATSEVINVGKLLGGGYYAVVNIFCNGVLIDFGATILHKP